MKVEIDTEEQKVEVLPVFTLCVLAAIKNAPNGRATAREIRDRAIETYRRSRDAAQVHIALDRLKSRQLVKPIEARKKEGNAPRLWTLTAEGLATLEETVRMMKIMCAFAEDGTIPKGSTPKGATKGESGHERSQSPRVRVYAD